MNESGEWQQTYYSWLHTVAEPYWKYWARVRSDLESVEQWRVRRNYLKAVFLDAIGGLPHVRANLNARSLGCVRARDYVLERVVFESVPGLLVTANLYLPSSLSGPAPAILVACGHWENGKSYEIHRLLCAALATKGYVVLIYDPIGQGERYMYLDPEGRPRRSTCTSQHTHLGVQLAAAGINLARYMIWDSMRAIDYLLSRPEVDPSRIGMTGCSGGGTNTAYTAALDERIAAAMPVCYITTIEQRQRSGVIADNEQNLYGQTERGLDHHEYVAMVAPRPICIGAADEDYFPLSGTREAFEAAMKVYELLEVPERCQLVVAHGQHGYLPELREAAYAFFNRWLGVAADESEPDVELVDEEDTLCLSGGVPAEGTFRVILQEAWAEAAELQLGSLSGEALREEIAQRVAHVPELVSTGAWESDGPWHRARVCPAGAPPADVVRLGDTSRVSRVVLAPDMAAARSALSATEADAAIILPLSQEPSLARRAETAESLDPRAALPWTHSSESFCAFYCQLLGRDWVFMRAAQVLACLHAVGRGPLSLAAEGLLSLPALYAAALDEKVAELVLREPLWTYRDILECELHLLAPGEVPWAIAGNHDVPAVMALIAPRQLRVINPRGADGRLLPRDSLPGLEDVVAAFRHAGAEGAFVLETAPENAESP
ncbi:MAG: acetylxylan esterase [Armatimonadetes bacterium]|nr:acetylxylan esterase [Armatimonadota bacterium]